MREALALLTGALLAAAVLSGLGAAEARAQAPQTVLERPAAAAQRGSGIPRPGRTQREMALMSSLAGAGALLLAYGAWLRRRGRPAHRRRLRDTALVALAVAGALAWWNVQGLRVPQHLHVHDAFHYYVGVKYFPELGYTGLYECTAIADLEAGRLEPGAQRRLRNLATNELEPVASLLEEPERCKRRFSPARWQAFAGDVSAFRARASLLRWSRMQVDHGYNATPAWAILGRPLAEWIPTSPGGLRTLALLDQLLLLAMWGCVGWAFGWRGLCVALLFWGTNYFGRYGWVGGSFLRQSWLVASVAGVCLLRRERHFAGGFALTWAALLRLFPGALIGALGLAALVRMARARSLRLLAHERRFALGCVAGLALLVPLSIAATESPRSWLDFAQNIELHRGTPLRNHMGLRTVVAYEHATRSQQTKDSRAEDPWQAWKQARLETFERRRGVFAGLVLAYLALLAWALRGQPPWIAAALGVAAIPVGFELTCYYYSLLLVLALLWTRYEAVGVAALGLAALSWLLASRFDYFDEIFTWIGLSVVVFAVATTAWVGAQRGGGSSACPSRGECATPPGSEVPGK